MLVLELNGKSAEKRKERGFSLENTRMYIGKEKLSSFYERVEKRVHKTAISSN